MPEVFLNYVQVFFSLEHLNQCFFIKWEPFYHPVIVEKMKHEATQGGRMYNKAIFTVDRPILYLGIKIKISS